ncbi:MAG: DUF1330 domain-containing protein [Gemmobacter sp.]
MPKGYWVAQVDVTDPVAYEEYRQANAAPFARHGARFLVRGGAATVAEGQARARIVVLEFPTIEAAHACWDDPDYQAARALRRDAGLADVVIVEGCDG